MVFMVALLDPFTDEIMRFAWTRLLPLALLAGIIGVFFRAAFEGLLAVIVTSLRRRSIRRRALTAQRSPATSGEVAPRPANDAAGSAVFSAPEQDCLDLN